MCSRECRTIRFMDTGALLRVCRGGSAWEILYEGADGSTTVLFSGLSVNTAVATYEKIKKEWVGTRKVLTYS